MKNKLNRFIYKIVLITFISIFISTNIFAEKTNTEKNIKEKELLEDEELKDLEEEIYNIEDKDLQKEMIYPNTDENINKGTLEINILGNLECDVYVVLEQEATGFKSTFYISPYRDNRNIKELKIGNYIIHEIFMLDKDYENIYEFKHNDKIIILPDEQMFFDIKLIDNQKDNELDSMLNENTTDLENTEIKNTEEQEEVLIQDKEVNPITKYLIIGLVILVIIGLIIFVKKSNLLLKD